MTRRADLLARIRKCMALAKSANEHEAAAALAHARRLMDEHGVDEAAIAELDVEEASARGNGAWTPSRWESSLIAVVTRAIPCKAICFGDSGWRFIGIAPAPQIAAYAFTALYRRLKAARSEYSRTALKRVKSPARRVRRADAYCEGWATAVFSKIAALYPQQETDALVVGYLERRYPDTRSIKPRDNALGGAAGENDRGRGWAAGRDVDLHKGVGTTEVRLLGTAGG